MPGFHLKETEIVFFAPTYEKTGVAECWIVDLEMGTIEVYVLEKSGYRLLGRWGESPVTGAEGVSGGGGRDCMPELPGG